MKKIDRYTFAQCFGDDIQSRNVTTVIEIIGYLSSSHSSTCPAECGDHLSRNALPFPV